MAQGIQLAGGYGAGGVRDALVEIIAQRLAQQQFEELKDARRSRDDQARAELAQRRAEMNTRAETDASRLALDRQQHAETLGLNVKKLDEDTRRSNRDYARGVTEFDTTHEFRKGESARNQANADRSFGLNEMVARESGRHNRAMEGIAGQRATTAGNTRTVKISFTDPETGQTFEEYVTPQEARERGPLRKGMSPKDLDAGNAMTDYVKKIDDAIALGDKSGWAGTGVVEGRLSGMLGGKFASEEALQLRGLIGDLFAENAHERFGGALTAQEIERAKSYLAESTDDPKKIRVNLQRMKAVVMPALERWQARRGATAPGGGAENDPLGIR